MTRIRHSTKARLAMFVAADGICHICQGKITPGEAWELEHVIPLAQGGADDASNLRPSHVKCHKAKTRQDASDTAKAKRREADYLGATAAPRQAIQSRGFAKAGPQNRASRPLTKPLPPRNNMG